MHEYVIARTLLAHRGAGGRGEGPPPRALPGLELRNPRRLIANVFSPRVPLFPPCQSLSRLFCVAVFVYY